VSTIYVFLFFENLLAFRYSLFGIPISDVVENFSIAALPSYNGCNLTIDGEHIEMSNTLSPNWLSVDVNPCSVTHEINFSAPTGLMIYPYDPQVYQPVFFLLWIPSIEFIYSI